MSKIEASADRLLDILDNVDVGNLNLYDLEQYVNMLKNIAEVQAKLREQAFKEKSMEHFYSNLNSGICLGLKQPSINELQ